MRIGELRKVGHWPTLLACFVHFEVSFAVWVLLGVLAPYISKDLGLSAGMAGVVVAVPLLSGAFFRIILGWLADVFGPRTVGTASMICVLAPLALGWTGGDSMAAVAGIGFLLGIAGASFAVALPLAASHYPPSHRGLALGIAGAGNSGTIVAGLVAPRVAAHLGWHNTLAVAMVPVALAAVAFRVLSKDAGEGRQRRKLSAVFGPLKQADCWRLSGLYAVTFGGFVGLASYLPTLLVSRYGVSPVTAGALAAAAAGTGSLLRPVGGSMADRVGGARVLLAVLAAAGVLAAGLGFARGLTLGAGLVIALLGFLGAANGAVFQMVSLRFSGSLGLVTGIVGAAGGIGGFLLPMVLGLARQQTGSFAPGFWLFAALALLIAAPSVMAIRARWRRMPQLAFGERAI